MKRNEFLTPKKDKEIEFEQKEEPMAKQAEKEPEELQMPADEYIATDYAVNTAANGIGFDIRPAAVAWIGDLGQNPINSTVTLAGHNYVINSVSMNIDQYGNRTAQITLQG